MEEECFIGVDVGTGSVRAGIFSSKGKLIALSKESIRVNSPETNYYQQSSDEIWNAVCKTINEIVKRSENTLKVRGISFCATCSLVALDSEGQPVSICKSGSPEWNVLMWMDHRATKEIALINSTKHPILEIVGGTMALEMQPPKLLWLQNNLPDSFKNTAYFFDLSDFLRWKASGKDLRSICTLHCKWGFEHHPDPSFKSSHSSFYKEIGLQDVLPKIGHEISYPCDFTPITSQAAEDFGLEGSIKEDGILPLIGYSMIDAHCGFLGMIACKNTMSGNRIRNITKRLGLISGTSTCVMAVNEHSIHVKGIWGPYYGVIMDEYYLAEGGQSSSGSLIDHIVSSHPQFSEILQRLGTLSAVLEELEKLLERMAKTKKLEDIGMLTKDFHMWPDFHGNRSPLANLYMKGMICGLELDRSVENLCLMYLGTLQSLSYGIRFIMEHLIEKGYAFDEIVICGGLTKSRLYLETLGNVCNLPIVIPFCEEPVLLGAAISSASAVAANAVASESFDQLNSNARKKILEKVMDTMGGEGVRILPDQTSSKFHEKKYQVFLQLYQDQLKYIKMMN